MEAFAGRLTVGTLNGLDALRSWLLRTLLSFSFARNIFISRAQRLQFLFLIAFFAYLFLSTAFPLWVLATGPILYGLPHILASLRYSHHAVDPTKSASRSFQTLSFLWIAVLTFRLLTQFDLLKINPEIVYGNSPELLATALTIIGCWHIYRRSKLQAILSLLMLTPLAFFSTYAPGETLGALVMIHNFVAFIFWHRSTQTREEKQVVLTSFTLFLLANTAIFTGAFDSLFTTTPTLFSSTAFGGATSILHDSLNTQDVGHLIAPWSSDPSLYLHCVMAYAFGQSLHYFIWLKAIPDQHHTRPTPTTFRESFHILKKDYGRTLLLGMSTVCAIGVGIYLCFEYSVARGVYFSFAAYHGYLELAVLSFAHTGSWLRD